MDDFNTREGQDFISMVPEYLRIIANEMKRGNELKEEELKLMQRQLPITQDTTEGEANGN